MWRSRRWKRSSPESSRRPAPPMTPPDALVTRPDPQSTAGTVSVTALDGSVPDLGLSTGGLRAYLSKYLAIFRVSFAERMTYRVDFLVGTILRFLPMVTTILLWQAIYVGSKQTSPGG